MPVSVPTPLIRGFAARRQRPALAAFVVVIGALLAMPSPSWAQGLRADVIAAEQAEKARHLGPGVPTRAEQIVTKVHDTFLQPRDGLYPYIDSVYGGGGFTLGAGFLRYYGDRSTADLHGLYSVKNYKLLEITTTSPGHLSGRLTLDARAGWRDATRVGYYGLGIETDADARANYRFKESYVGGAATLHPARWAVLAGGVDYEHYQLEPGQGSERPSIETEYTAETAPGLGANPGFVHSQVTGAHRLAHLAGLQPHWRLLRADPAPVRRSRQHVHLQAPRRERGPAHPRAERNVGAVAAGPHAGHVRR